MKDMNSGYHGYSMSNRAVQAYDRGEMPWSKWTKTALVEQMIADEWDAKVIGRVKRISLQLAKCLLLKNTGWHHTGKYCQRTQFYCLIDERSLDKWVKFDINDAEDALDAAIKAGDEERVEKQKKRISQLMFLKGERDEI